MLKATGSGLNEYKQSIRDNDLVFAETPVYR